MLALHMSDFGMLVMVSTWLKKNSLQETAGKTLQSMKVWSGWAATVTRLVQQLQV